MSAAHYTTIQPHDGVVSRACIRDRKQGAQECNGKRRNPDEEREPDWSPRQWVGRHSLRIIGLLTSWHSKRIRCRTRHSGAREGFVPNRGEYRSGRAKPPAKCEQPAAVERLPERVIWNTG
jgi:hypothetical protein